MNLRISYICNYFFNVMIQFKRIDFLVFTYLLISTVFLWLSWQTIEAPLQLLFVRFFIVISVLGIIYFHKKSSHTFFSFIRHTYPLMLSGYFYSETVFYNKFFFTDFDPELSLIESSIFGSQLSLDFSANFPSLFFSELMYFSYFSFYLIIFGFTLYMYFKKENDFCKANFQLASSLYIFYIIFLIFPSAGPQFYFTAPQNSLPEAYVFDEIMHFIQRTAEQPTGAFPSSHVGISIIILMISRKIAPVFFKMAWPFVVLLILSTVYIKAHYAIDVLGGLLVAPFVLYLSKILYRSLAKGSKS